MVEIIDFLNSVGATDERRAKRAINVFFEEFNSLEGDSSERVFEEKNHIIDLIREIIQDSAVKGAVDYKPALQRLIERLPKKHLSIIKKISKMVQTDDANDFHRIKSFAAIAAHVYGNRKDSILPYAWRCLGNEYHNLKLDDQKSGLQACLYLKHGDKPQYIYAIAGTKGWDIKDWKANIGQIAGISDQYDRAGEIAEKLAKDLGSERITMVGHSKGGGQAAYCALRTGSRAITFNPAGLGLYKFNQDIKTENNINSYVMVKDPLNLMQMLAQLLYADLTADGSVHYLKNDKSSSISDWHGINGFLRLGGMTDMHRIPI